MMIVTHTLAFGSGLVAMAAIASLATDNINFLAGGLVCMIGSLLIACKAAMLDQIKQSAD